MIKNGDIQLIINTPSGKIPREDEVKMRTRRAQKIPIITTMRAAQASVHGIASLQKSSLHVRTLQEYHAAESAVKPAAVRCHWSADENDLARLPDRIGPLATTARSQEKTETLTNPSPHE